jgi:hypothetical protein
MIRLAVILSMIDATTDLMTDPPLVLAVKKVEVVAEVAVVSENFHLVERYSKADCLLGLRFTMTTMLCVIGMIVRIATARSVVLLWFEVDIEVVLLILIIEVRQGEDVVDEDVVTTKAMQSPEVIQVPSMPKLRMANRTRILGVLIEVAKVVSDAALLVFS